MVQTTIRPTDVVHTVKEHPWRVIGPVALITLLALFYAMARPKTWEASQALVVRDEAGDRLTRPGKFTQVDEMKATQETVLELARSRGVLLKALTEVGPPADFDTANKWPTEAALEGLQDSVRVTPPKGAEFGKTEVFYLKVKASSPERAVKLALAICTQLQNGAASMREAMAQSTTKELTRSLSLAQADLDAATTKLGAMEKLVGNDLAELRILSESPSGDSDLRRTATELDREIRGYHATQSENEESLKLLKEAQHDPSTLLASPSVLLKAQPGLARLKDGLVDAQLRSGQALGTMSETHPVVLGAREAEKAIRAQLHDEISLAIRGVEVDLHVNADRIQSLEKQQASVEARLNKLAALRAEYTNLANTAKSRGETVKAVEHDLAEAKASEAASRVSSRISLFDQPDVGTRPVGPGKASLVGAGFGGGLMIAAALIFLSIAPVAPGPIPVSSPTLNRSTFPSVANIGAKATLTMREALQKVKGQI